MTAPADGTAAHGLSPDEGRDDERRSPAHCGACRGARPLLTGLLWLVVDPTAGGFSASLLGAFLLIGTGLGLSAVNATAMAVRDSAEGEAGLLSGLINTAQQLGGAVGLAALAGVAIGAARTETGAGISFPTAFTGAAALITTAIALSLIPAAATRSAPDTAGAR
ncbi:hypothetical protein CLV63_102110 [Murinocardiopsis flavida]|uniref:MFS transporter n=1 Tax=Murinocardiopsis flavida TaxID=645275 RepID=A0A2P8DRY1_9ACTN|nr:hypothetical protein [Murinocardiopsis flavida]PSK99983.1 hypothetical protein CLV63_102110 [Murinocardiopsis flavida]